jgi:uncharacterized protein YkwD
VSIHLCVLRILIVGTVFAALPAITASQEQTGADKSEMVSAKVRRQARELALRFRRANDDVVLREQIANEAIELGKPYAEKLLGVALLDKTKSLKSYGTDFSKQIDKADKITAEGVVSSSKKLPEARRRLIHRAKLENNLRAFLHPNPRPGLHPNPRPAAGDNKNKHKETKQTANPGFAELLRVEEERAVEQWLLQQGYRRLTHEESSVIAAINRLRLNAGLEKLEVDYKLCFASRDHSRDMLQKQFFSHTSPVRGKKTFVQRAKRLGTLAFAENIARCRGGESPITLWLNSKPHKKNMFRKGFNTIGVGCAGNNYTAMFGRKIQKKPKTTTEKKGQ